MFDFVIEGLHILDMARAELEMGSTSTTNSWSDTTRSAVRHVIAH